jgi:hypothetical protein
MTNATNKMNDRIESNTIKLSMPRLMLHLEALAVLIATIAIYFNQGYGTLTFLALLLAPDLAFIVYAADKKMGIFAYNLAHFVGFPALLIASGVLGDWSSGVQLGLIWAAHIAMDRAIGYGLKYPDDFKHTHMQNV